MKRFNNVYFINGTAYAGKSTIVKMLAKIISAIDNLS
jgi:ABC-type ATPase involved in cell division